MEKSRGGGAGYSKWRQQSEEFREAMRAMRRGGGGGGGGGGMSSYKPSKPDPSLVQCPYCGRRFNQIAADRHIPICKNTINRPKPPPSLTAGGRLSRGGGGGGGGGGGMSSSLPKLTPNKRAQSQRINIFYYYV